MPRTLGSILLFIAASIAQAGGARADISALGESDTGADRMANGFLKAHPIWRVSADPSWRPYSFRAADGQLVGLDVELSRVLAERIGVRIEWVSSQTWVEAEGRFRSGEVDLLMGTAATPEREAEMLFTAPYAASPVAVIARKDAPFLVTLHDLAGQTVAAPEAHVTTQYLQKVKPDFKIVIYPQLADAIRAVAEGRADAMVSGLIPAATTICALNFDNLKVAGLVDMRFDLRVAVRRDWPEARRLLDEAIAADPPEVRIARFDRWIRPVMGLQRQALRWHRLFQIGLAIAGSLALGILAVVIWNRTLRAKVAKTTATIRAEMAARAESETRFRTMFEQAPIGMFRSTPAGTFVSVNLLLARLFEYESPDGMVEEVNRTGIAETLFEDAGQRARIVATVLERPGGLLVSQVRYRTRTGRPLDALLSMAAIEDPVDGKRTLLGFVQDITERVRNEATRRQREKLLALGQMAAGVVHDFNNLLSVIIGETEMLAADFATEPRVSEPARRIREAVMGASDVSGRLLRFARARDSEFAVTYDAHRAIRTALKLFHSAGVKHTRVVEAMAAARSDVVGVEADLQNAILNLCLNARDAMPTGGTLNVRTRVVDLAVADGAARAPYAVTPGSHLEIEVADQGSGMAPEVLASCTQPFFTTKGEAGTGLGLWTVHCVAASHGGSLRIASALGQGTTITMELPLAASAQYRH